MWYRYICLLLLLCAPLVSGAQFSLDSLTTRQSTIVLNPAQPGPGDVTEATIDAGSSVFGAEITWTYNDQILEEFANQRTATIQAGDAGASYTLTATLNKPDGSFESITTTISPVYLDIIIEPQTRTPDWYQGRSLPSYASQINATALLHNGTSFLDSNNLVYNWQIDRNPIENGAIRGGNKVSFETPRGNGPILQVSVSNLNGQTIASRAVRMNVVAPDVLFYEKHSLYGTQNQPIQSNANIIGNILTMQAEPYNLDTRVYNRPDIAQWELNNQVTSNGVSNPYEITLSRAGVGGSTLVNFHVRSLQEVLQGVESSIAVNF